MGELAVGSSDVVDSLEGVDTVLFLAPSLDSPDGGVCVDHLAANGDHALFVSLVGLPDARISAWRARRPTGSTAVVLAGDTTRSAAAAGGDVDDDAGQVRTVGDPGNLTRLGVEISDVLHDWAADGADIAICFHSLTILLQYVDRKPAFRFLHVLCDHVHSADATAHFHMDPAAHDETAIGTFASLVDATVEHDDDGWSIRSR